MKVLVATPIFQPYDTGRFVLKALTELGHSCAIWDYRLTPKIPTQEYDVALVLKGESIDPTMLRHPRVNWYPDNLVRNEEMIKKVEMYDAFYTINKESHGVWLPGAYDEDVHKKMSIDRELNFDLVFIGTNNHPWKLDFLRHLRRSFNFPVFGNNWPQSFAYPPLYFQDYAIMLNNAKIALNLHWDHQHGTNRKTFEIPPCTLMLTDRVEGIGDIFGRLADKMSFETPEEAKELIQFYLENEEERLKVWEWQKAVIEPYTYKNQVAKILGGL